MGGSVREGVGVGSGAGETEVVGAGVGVDEGVAEEVGDGCGVIEGAGAGINTPLFQISFLPFLIQVKVFPDVI